ncbi:serine hydrolase [Nakamurella sp.]|uniref:serine hydrolase n=1 Tax=Nakamurella sp. TaxID=1869182 RepID=UPI0037832BF1
MGAGARRSRGHRAGRAGVLLASLLAVAGLVIALAAHRDDARANPNSAIFVSVPPLTRPASTDPTVPPLAGPDADPLTPAGRGGLNTAPITPGDDAATSAPWPAPPADPTAAVDAALAQATSNGVTMGVVVLDRPTGAVLVARGADTPYPSLSLLKVMIAADVLTNGWPTDPAEPGTTEPGTTDIAPAAPASAGPARPSAAEETGAEPDDPQATEESLPMLTDPAQIDTVLTRMIATSDDVIASDLYDATGGDEMVQRVATRYGMTGTTPTPDGTYWGNVQLTPADLATLLTGVLADPLTASVIGPAMRATTAIAADGVDQRFGMRLVPGAGSKQGWGCCLSGIAGIHSMGFTADRIVVVLSGSVPDDEGLGEQDGPALQADPGGMAGQAAVDDVVRAALGGPAG